MRTGAGMLMLTSVCLVPALGVSAYTDKELVDKGRMMVWESLDERGCEVADGPEEVDWVFWTRDGFFDHFVTNGWTRAMCETAFSKYLESISTNDMSTFSRDDKWIAKGALGQCIDMCYTNALDAIRAYALNTTAVDRATAIETAVEFGGVDESAASFVEMIVTNDVLFTYNDICCAIPKYCDKLLTVNTNDSGNVAIRDRGVRLFYAKRHVWQDGTSLDNLFSACINGYSFSSNRLEYARHVLSWTTNNDWRAMRDHFVAITNQLHSSNQPLVAITIGEQ